MPITENELRQANQQMLGNTNRGILFTTVNLSQDAPRLEDMVAYLQAGVLTWEQFYAQVKDKLTVTSFPEFCQKLQPCFYYRLRPPEGAIEEEAEEEFEEGEEEDLGEDEEAAPEDEAEEESAEEAEAEEVEAEEAEATEEEVVEEGRAFDIEELPYYEFSLEGGPPEVGWRKVVIGVDHPYIKSLQGLIKERALMGKSTFAVNIDAALFGFKPRTQQLMVRKSAQDLQAGSDKLMLEMKRNADSPDTRRALEAYDRRVEEFENALGDDLRVLPTVTHGLAEARKALGAGGPSTGPALGEYVLALGERAQVVARPALPEETMRALPAGALEAPAETGKEIVRLSDALSSRPLAKRELSEIATMPDNDRFPAVVGTFMSEMIRLHKIDPQVGGLLAVVLNDPKQLATWSIDPQELDVFHDTFLGIYSQAVESFLRIVTPLMEAVMGVYMLFNEFPATLRRGRPELIVANSELTDLWQVYQEETAAFLRACCHQAANQYRDAVSFAVVPAVTAFQNEAPASPPTGYIEAGDFVNQYRAPEAVETDEDRIKLDEKIEELRHQRTEETGGIGRVTGAGEVLGLMELGYECGFQVIFSPEEKVIAGRTRSEYLEAVQDNYCTASVVDQDWASCGVLCLPDFVCLPPDGILITGKVVDGREVGVEVPEVVVRSCYVAAGRLMCNDVPEVLRSVVSKVPKKVLQAQPMKVRTSLPGVGTDLTKYTVLGQSSLPVDHFLDDSILKTLLARDSSFLVFGQVAGISPNIAAPRTLHRSITEAGERYELIHHYRQRVYLKRLINAAYHLGLGGAWPSGEDMGALMDQLIKFWGWYDINHEGYVNSFPSELQNDELTVEPIEEAGQLLGYAFNMLFVAGVLGEMELTFA